MNRSARNVLLLLLLLPSGGCWHTSEILGGGFQVLKMATEAVTEDKDFGKTPPPRDFER